MFILDQIIIERYTSMIDVILNYIEYLSKKNYQI